MTWLPCGLLVSSALSGLRDNYIELYPPVGSDFWTRHSSLVAEGHRRADDKRVPGSRVPGSTEPVPEPGSQWFVFPGPDVPPPTARLAPNWAHFQNYNTSDFHSVPIIHSPDISLCFFGTQSRASSPSRHNICSPCRWLLQRKIVDRVLTLAMSRTSKKRILGSP